VNLVPIGAEKTQRDAFNLVAAILLAHWASTNTGASN
jgi:hypothetical protein